MVEKNEAETGDIMPSLSLLAEDHDKYTEYKIWGTSIAGLLVWERKSYPDERGAYQEICKTDEIAKVLGHLLIIKQISLSKNEPRGVLRGLHAEPMDKIVTPLNGRIFIAVADIRPDSKTFGKYVAFTIDQRDQTKPTRSIVISNGLANSFLTIGDEKDGILNYLYGISEPYKTSEGKRSVRYDDPDLHILWPIKPEIMSEVDRGKNPSLRELFPDKFS